MNADQEQRLIDAIAFALAEFNDVGHPRWLEIEQAKTAVQAIVLMPCLGT